MNTDLNYPVIAVFLILALALIIFLIWKNNKDEKDIVKDLTKGDFIPQDHKNESL